MATSDDIDDLVQWLDGQGLSGAHYSMDGDDYQIDSGYKPPQGRRYIITREDERRAKRNDQDIVRMMNILEAVAPSEDQKNKLGPDEECMTHEEIMQASLTHWDPGVRYVKKKGTSTLKPQPVDTGDEPDRNEFLEELGIQKKPKRDISPDEERARHYAAEAKAAEKSKPPPQNFNELMADDSVPQAMRNEMKEDLEFIKHNGNVVVDRVVAEELSETLSRIKAGAIPEAEVHKLNKELKSIRHHMLHEPDVKVDEGSAPVIPTPNRRMNDAHRDASTDLMKHLNAASSPKEESQTKAPRKSKGRKSKAATATPATPATPSQPPPLEQPSPPAEVKEEQKGFIQRAKDSLKSSAKKVYDKATRLAGKFNGDQFADDLETPAPEPEASVESKGGEGGWIDISGKESALTGLSSDVDVAPKDRVYIVRKGNLVHFADSYKEMETFATVPKKKLVGIKKVGTTIEHTSKNGDKSTTFIVDKATQDRVRAELKSQSPARVN